GTVSRSLNCQASFCRSSIAWNSGSPSTSRIWICLSLTFHSNIKSPACLCGLQQGSFRALKCFSGMLSAALLFLQTKTAPPFSLRQCPHRSHSHRSARMVELEEPLCEASRLYYKFCYKLC